LAIGQGLAQQGAGGQGEFQDDRVGGAGGGKGVGRQEECDRRSGQNLGGERQVHVAGLAGPAQQGHRGRSRRGVGEHAARGGRVNSRGRADVGGQRLHIRFSRGPGHGVPVGPVIAGVEQSVRGAREHVLALGLAHQGLHPVVLQAGGRPQAALVRALEHAPARAGEECLRTVFVGGQAVHLRFGQAGHRRIPGEAAVGGFVEAIVPGGVHLQR